MNTREKRFWKGAALVSAEMLGAMLLYSSLVAGFFLLTRRRWRKYKPSDLRVFEKLEPLRTAALNRRVEKLTFLGNHKFLIPANLAVLFYYLLLRKRTWFSIRIIAIALSSLGMMLLLKQAFRRKRPAQPLLYAVKGKSFPSGHALMSITFYGLLIHIIYSTVKSPLARGTGAGFFVTLIALIGFSRIYLKVHYASDVLAGFAIGGGWLAVSLTTLQKLEDFNRKQLNVATPGSFSVPPVLSATPR